MEASRALPLPRHALRRLHRPGHADQQIARPRGPVHPGGGLPGAPRLLGRHLRAHRRGGPGGNLRPLPRLPGRPLLRRRGLRHRRRGGGGRDLREHQRLPAGSLLRLRGVWWHLPSGRSYGSRRGLRRGVGVRRRPGVRSHRRHLPAELRRARGQRVRARRRLHARGRDLLPRGRHLRRLRAGRLPLRPLGGAPAPARRTTSWSATFRSSSTPRAARTAPASTGSRSPTTPGSWATTST